MGQLVERVADGQVALHRDGHGEVDASGQANLLSKVSKIFFFIHPFDMITLKSLKEGGRHEHWRLHNSHY